MDNGVEQGHKGNQTFRPQIEISKHSGRTHKRGDLAIAMIPPGQSRNLFGYEKSLQLFFVVTVDRWAVNIFQLFQYKYQEFGHSEMCRRDVTLR